TVIRRAADPEVETALQCTWLRCLFPWLRFYLFAFSPALPPSVLVWNNGIVRRIAEGIAAERAFDGLPLLADALLEGGCENDDLIAHCRSKGPHTLGCWAIDLIVEKE